METHSQHTWCQSLCIFGKQAEYCFESAATLADLYAKLAKFGENLAQFAVAKPIVSRGQNLNTNILFSNFWQLLEKVQGATRSGATGLGASEKEICL